MDSKLTPIQPSPNAQGSRPSQRRASSEAPRPLAGGYIKAQEAKEKTPPGRRLSAQAVVELPSGAFEPLRGQEMLRDALRLVKPLATTPAELREGLRKLVTQQVLQGYTPQRVAVALVQCIEAVFGVPAQDDKRSAGEAAAADRVLRATFEAFVELPGVNLGDVLGPVLASTGQPGAVVIAWLLGQSSGGLPRGDLWSAAMETLVGVAGTARKTGDWLQDGLSGMARAQQRCWDEAAMAPGGALIDSGLSGRAGPDPSACKAASAKVLAHWGSLQLELCRRSGTLTPAQIEDFLAAAVAGEQLARKSLEESLDTAGMKARLHKLLQAAVEADASIARCGAVVAGLRNGMAHAWPDARATYLPALREGIRDALTPVSLALGADASTRSDYQRFLVGRLVDGQAKGEPVSRPTAPATEDSAPAAALPPAVSQPPHGPAPLERSAEPAPPQQPGAAAAGDLQMVD